MGTARPVISIFGSVLSTQNKVRTIVHDRVKTAQDLRPQTRLCLYSSEKDIPLSVAEQTMRHKPVIMQQNLHIEPTSGAKDAGTTLLAQRRAWINGAASEITVPPGGDEAVYG